ATVVVVGETKRGKSSLVNALLEAPGLSPVDASVATSSYLEFVHSPVPSAQAFVPGEPEPIDIPLDQLRAWGTHAGGLPDGQRPPRKIRIGYPAALLQRVRLVDTPGAGGLDAAHAGIALDAVNHATALLFVLDASSPLSRPELDFLIEASRRVNGVLFAVTKIDAYPGWRIVLDDDDALLRSHASRFADARFYGVSSRLAELSVSAPPATAGVLAAQSGVSELRKALAALGGERAELFREANVLRAIRSELVTVDAELNERLHTVDPDTATAMALKMERSQFATQKRSDARTWSLTLAAETRRARTNATAYLRTQLQQLQEWYLGVVDSARGERIEDLPREVDQALHSVSLQISTDLEGRFRSIGQRVLREVFTDSGLQRVLGQINAQLHIDRSPKARREVGPDQSLVVTSAASTAVIAGRGAAAGTALAVGGSGVLASLAIPVIGVGLGLAAGAFLLFRRRVNNDRQQAKLWLKEVLAESRAAMADEISHRFTDLELALTISLDHAVERRVEQLDLQIAQIDAAMAVDKSERLRRKQQLQDDREAVRARVRQLDDVLAQVRVALGELPRS
ncbi:MAG: dynamin family protein, partial [Mycobacteriales bacterium]